MTLIGGHDGMEVHRIAAGQIVKVALDAAQRSGLSNEYRMLQHMQGRCAPAAIEWGDGPHPELGGIAYLIEEDVGDSEPIRLDSNGVRHAMIRLLSALRAAGVRHGDLTSRNIIVKDGGARLYAIDWQESHLLTESAPQKSPYTDSDFACRWIAETADSDSGLDTPRVARRWRAVLRALGASNHSDVSPLPLSGRRFIDYGCYMGDFPALAACEGMDALGLDTGGFRTGEDSIATGLAVWEALGVVGMAAAIGGRLRLARRNVLALRPDEMRVDVAVCFSTWPYLITQTTRETAEAWLRWAIEAARDFFFEVQLAGDGPGPAWLQSDDDVQAMLDRITDGAAVIAPIVTIPVVGRNAERTVWHIRTPR